MFHMYVCYVFVVLKGSYHCHCWTYFSRAAPANGRTPTVIHVVQCVCLGVGRQLLFELIQYCLELVQYLFDIPRYWQPEMLRNSGLPPLGPELAVLAQDLSSIGGISIVCVGIVLLSLGKLKCRIQGLGSIFAHPDGLPHFSQQETNNCSVCPILLGTLFRIASPFCNIRTGPVGWLAFWFRKFVKKRSNLFCFPQVRAVRVAYGCGCPLSDLPNVDRLAGEFVFGRIAL